MIKTFLAESVEARVFVSTTIIYHRDMFLCQLVSSR